MAELSTIARPYAEALFEASREHLPQVQAWMERLGVLASNPDLQAYADHPRVQRQQVYDTLVSLFDEPLSSQASNFLRLVIDNGRLAAVPEMARQFRQLANAAGGVHDAVVYTPYALSDADLKQLQSDLEKRFDRKLQINQKTDASLIGGVRVVVGDEVFDTSVKAQLEHMRAVLMS